MQNDIQKHYDDLRQAEADAKYWLQQYENQLNAEREAKVQEAEAEHAKRVEELKQNFEAETSSVREQFTSIMERLKYTAAAWDMEAWLGFPEESPEDAISTSLRAGSIQRDFPASDINQVPLLIPMIGEKHVFIVSQGEGKAQGRKLLQSMALRALLLLADGNTEFIFIDPFGMGANFPFQSLPTSIRGEMIYVEEEEIDAQLRRLTDQIRKGEREKRYVLCVADFPRRFNEDALQRMISIAQQGVNSNVYAIVHVDSDVPLPDGYDPSVLLDSASVLFATADGTNARLDGEEYNFVADDLPDNALLEALLRKLAN